MAVDHWDRHEEGHLDLRPFHGFETGIAGISGFVRLSYGQSNEPSHGVEEAVQLAMTPEQLREFGVALIRTAMEIEIRIPVTKQ